MRLRRAGGKSPQECRRGRVEPRRAIGERLASHGEIPARAIDFDTAGFFGERFRHRATHEQFDAGAGRRNLGVGVALPDEIGRRRSEIAGVGVAAIIEIDADNPRLSRKHEADAIGDIDASPYFASSNVPHEVGSFVFAGLSVLGLSGTLVQRPFFRHQRQATHCSMRFKSSGIVSSRTVRTRGLAESVSTARLRDAELGMGNLREMEGREPWE